MRNNTLFYFFFLSLFVFNASALTSGSKKKFNLYDLKVAKSLKKFFSSLGSNTSELDMISALRTNMSLVASEIIQDEPKLRSSARVICYYAGQSQDYSDCIETAMKYFDGCSKSGHNCTKVGTQVLLDFHNYKFRVLDLEVLTAALFLYKKINAYQWSAKRLKWKFLLRLVTFGFYGRKRFGDNDLVKALSENIKSTSYPDDDGSQDSLEKYENFSLYGFEFLLTRFTIFLRMYTLPNAIYTEKAMMHHIGAAVAFLKVVYSQLSGADPFAEEVFGKMDYESVSKLIKRTYPKFEDYLRNIVPGHEHLTKKAVDEFIYKLQNIAVKVSKINRNNIVLSVSTRMAVTEVCVNKRKEPIELSKCLKDRRKRRVLKERVGINEYLDMKAMVRAEKQTQKRFFHRAYDKIKGFFKSK